MTVPTQRITNGILRRLLRPRREMGVNIRRRCQGAMSQEIVNEFQRDFLGEIGECGNRRAEGQGRTADTRIFSPLLYH